MLTLNSSDESSWYICIVVQQAAIRSLMALLLLTMAWRPIVQMVLTRSTRWWALTPSSMERWLPSLALWRLKRCYCQPIKCFNFCMDVHDPRRENPAWLPVAPLLRFSVNCLDNCWNDQHGNWWRHPRPTLELYNYVALLTCHAALAIFCF